MDEREKVRQLAYELYVQNGRREGHELLDWLTAEQIIRFEKTILAEGDGQRIELLEYKPMTASGAQAFVPPKLHRGRLRKAAGRADAGRRR